MKPFPSLVLHVSIAPATVNWVLKPSEISAWDPGFWMSGRVWKDHMSKGPVSETSGWPCNQEVVTARKRSMTAIHDCHSLSLPQDIHTPVLSTKQILEEEKGQRPLNRGGWFRPPCDTGKSWSQLWGLVLQRTLERSTEKVAVMKIVLSFAVPIPIAQQPFRLCWHLARDSTSMPQKYSPLVSMDRSTYWGQFNSPKGEWPGWMLSEGIHLFLLTVERV